MESVRWLSGLRDGKKGGQLLLTGTEFQLNKMKRVVGMHGGDGSITM